MHWHRGEALVKLNRLQEALEEWERALAFAFPQRKMLEDKVQSLRTQLAKLKSAAPQDQDQENATSDDDSSDDDETP